MSKCTIFFVPIFVNLFRKDDRRLDYVIKEKKKNLYIRLDENGMPVTCSEHEKSLFEESKAKNILDHLPKTLRKWDFKIIALPEIKIKNKTIQEDKREVYIPSESITRWVDKFGECSDILTEAEEREKQLILDLKDNDKELIDLLHIIEIEKPKDLFSGWKLYKQIKNNRKQRRMMKDELLIIEDVLEEVKNTSCLHRNRIQKSIDGLFSREYAFRILEVEEE